jgi:hypothetical protein
MDQRDISNRLSKDAHCGLTWNFLIPASDVLDTIVLNQDITRRSGGIHVKYQALSSNSRAKSVHQNGVAKGAKR